MFEAGMCLGKLGVFYGDGVILEVRWCIQGCNIINETCSTMLWKGSP